MAISIKIKKPKNEIDIPYDEMCDNKKDFGKENNTFYCTRKKGHKGLHMAGIGGRVIVKTWKQKQ